MAAKISGSQGQQHHRSIVPFHLGWNRSSNVPMEGDREDARRAFVDLDFNRTTGWGSSNVFPRTSQTLADEKVRSLLTYASPHTEIFNNEPPHEALDMKCPAEVYQPSTRSSDIDYPFHDKIIVVTNCGRIGLGHKKIPRARHQRSSRIMIWDTSIWRLVCWNRSTTRSAQSCYPCSRYVL